MDDNLSIAPIPDGWLEILAESEAELAAGLTVDGDQRELCAAAEQIEATQTEEQARKATRGR